MSAERRIRCPVHGGGDPNVSLWRDDRGRLRAKCWSHGCDGRDILAALGEPERYATETSHRTDDAGRIELARRFWRNSVSAKGTAVERYVRARGISIPVPQTLRFHGSLKHRSGSFHPSMVAAVEHVRSGGP